MGFYHPATLVKDAQRRGVRFTGVDVQHSDWDAGSMPTAASGSACAMSPGCAKKSDAQSKSQDQAIGRSGRSAQSHAIPSMCPKCGCDDESMIETVRAGAYFCNTCSHDWTRPHRTLRIANANAHAPRFVRRRSRESHRHPPRRAADAGRHRRLCLVRLRAPRSAVAGGESRAARR